MHEIELKFQVEAGARAAVARAVATATARRTRLQAVYFDTPERLLAEHAVSLRLRKEGPRWVQTVKGGPLHGIQRLEHEVVLAARGAAPPPLVLERHAGHPAGERLLQLLKGAPRGSAGPAPALGERYRVDVTRLHRVQRVRGGQVELAFDSGRIVAGEASETISELEIESLRGGAPVVIEAARRWVMRFGVWLDPRSKAERGDRLARGLAQVDAVYAGKAGLASGSTPAAARQLAVAEALAQILPNAAEIASGAHHDEHVHQLRVALRRLRSLLRFLRLAPPSIDAATGAAGETAPVDGLPDDSTLDAALRELFRALGATRDADAIALALDPKLRAAGAPVVGLRPAAPVAAVEPTGAQAGVSADPAPDAADDIGRRLREPATTLLFLDLLAIAHAPEALPAPRPGAAGVAAPASRAAAKPPSAAATRQRGAAAPDDEALAPGTVAEPPAARAPDPVAYARLLRRRLQRWHRRVAISGKAFLALDDTARHALRKRAKRLRYATEFAGPLMRGKQAGRYLKRLRRVQEALGHFNDLCVAEAAYRELAQQRHEAWFAVGWLVAARQPALEGCARALDALGPVRDMGLAKAPRQPR